MSKKECIFCRIVKGEVSSEILYQDDLVIAFPDVNPSAPVHVLVIPKEHIESVNQLTKSEKHEKVAGRLILAAKQIAQEKGIAEDGYKLLLRTGKHGGQEIPHIHLHLFGGAQLSEDIRPLN